MESEVDPRRRKAPRDDDDAPGIPALDGADGDGQLETHITLDVADDEASALDDRTSADLPGTDDDDDGVRGEDDAARGDDEDAPPLEADPSLADGENERWTEGSDASEDVPWQERSGPEAHESSLDRGEEGFDDLGASTGDALPGLPPAHAGEEGDGEADELDVSEAGALETPQGDPDDVPALPVLALPVRWHGPPRESVSAVAIIAGQPMAGSRGLWILAGGQPAGGPTVASATEADVSALVEHQGTLWIATEAGAVLTMIPGTRPVAYARPGTDDASVGAIDLASAGDRVVARTRGGALFRSTDAAWVGPVVAKNVRRIRSALGAQPDWLALVVGSAAAPELLVTRDARTFERLRGPEGAVAIEAARSGDVVAVATASGALHVSRDAGTTYAAVPNVVDVERVWVTANGVVYAAAFHEATDHGRLLRVSTARAEVVLDVGAEIQARRLSGPGEHDGDGRVHALAVGPGETLWVATGVGVFELGHA